MRNRSSVNSGAVVQIPQHSTPRGTWCRFSGCDSKTGVCHLCKPVIPGLSEREAAALVALSASGDLMGGGKLGSLMRALGRATSTAAAHQAGAALTRKGLASKTIPGDGEHVRYEVTSAGRALSAEHLNPEEDR